MIINKLTVSFVVWKDRTKTQTQNKDKNEITTFSNDTFGFTLHWNC